MAPEHKPRRHLLLQLTVFALPFSYVPHEFGVRNLSVTPAVVALVLLVGARYGALGRRLGAMDTASILLASWIGVRILILGPLEDAAPDILDVVSSVGAVIAGIVMFRLARRHELRPAFKSGLRLSLLFLVAIAGYQSLAGLGRLQALGYTTGFYYFTFEGAFRPFGTFLSPTVFGAYLAMIGVAVTLLHRGWAAWAWFAVTAAGLLMTETRAAWIAAAAALVVVFFHRPGRARMRAVVWLVPAGIVALIFALTNLDLVGTIFDRLSGLLSDATTSRTARLSLWEGVLTVIQQSPIIGFGQTSFVDMLRPVAGDAAAFGHAHENYLQVLYLYGGIGLVLFLIVLVLAYRGIRVTLKQSPDSQFAYAALGGLVAFAVDSLFETTWLSLSVVTLLFLVVGLGYSDKIGYATRDGLIPGGSSLPSHSIGTLSS